MEKDQLNSRKGTKEKGSNWLERLLKVNKMDWGVIELAESVQPEQTRDK